MANVNISDLPAADVLDGSELVEVMQGGVNVQTTAQDIADLAPTPDGLAPAGGTTGQLLAKASDTDYDFEYVDAPTGGGGMAVVGQETGFTADGAANTLYTNEGVAGFTIATLSGDGPYTFFNQAGEQFWITAPSGSTLSFWDGSTSQTATADSATYLNLSSAGMSAQVMKINGTEWACIINNGGSFLAD